MTATSRPRGAETMKRRKGWHRKKRRLECIGVCGAFVRSYALGTTGVDNTVVMRMVREMLESAPDEMLDIFGTPKS